MKQKNLETLIFDGDKEKIIEYLNTNGLRKNVNPITFINDKENQNNEKNN